MKKVLLGILVLAVAVLVFVPLTKTQAALSAKATIIGKVKAHKNSQIWLKIKNNSTNGDKIKNVVIWVPSTWTIAYPSSNTAIRNRNFGPWSTQVIWNGKSQRAGYDAIWFKATPGTKRITAGWAEKFPLTLKTPTNQKAYNYKQKMYWMAETENGQIIRGSIIVPVVK